MKSSYYREWRARQRNKNFVGDPVQPSDSRISFASLGRKGKVPASKDIWNKSHPFVDNEYFLTQPDTKSTDPINIQSVSGRQSSYEIELLKYKFNSIENEIFQTADPTPVEVIISPASSSLFGPDLSDDSSSVQVPVPAGRKNFVSLRGLPGFHPTPESPRISASEFEELQTNNSYALKTSKPLFLTVPLLEDKNQPKVKVIESGSEASSDTLEGSVMSDSQPREVHAHVIPKTGPEDDVVSRDKSTSPFLQETDVEPTVEMKTFHVHTKPPKIKPTPHYPFETGNNSRQGRVLNRPTVHNGLLRSNRLQDYSHPSVVSSTQQLLCLTPSRGGVITLGSEEDVNKVARLNEHNPVTQPARRAADHDSNAPVPLATAIVTRTTSGNEKQYGNTFYRLMQKNNSPRPRTSTAHGQPFSLANIHYKHTTQIRKPYRYPAISPSASAARKTDGGVSKTPVFERNATAMSMAKSPANTTFKIIENHVRWNRRLPVFNPDDVPNVYPYQPCFTIHDPGAQSRKMAPVLRVIPAFPQTTKTQFQRRAKIAKSPVDTEGASQKKVRFTDQIGLPLVRNATPNYRRKHSYILRWLETAGRPAKTIPLV